MFCVIYFDTARVNKAWNYVQSMTRTTSDGGTTEKNNQQEIFSFCGLEKKIPIELYNPLSNQWTYTKKKVLSIEF